jgi:hypothetical protein
MTSAALRQLAGDPMVEETLSLDDPHPGLGPPAALGQLDDAGRRVLHTTRQDR